MISTTKATSWRHSTRMVTGTPAHHAGTTLIPHLTLKRFSATKQIEAINHMKHSITIDTVIMSIATLHSIDRTTKIAHILQYVIKL